MRITEQHWCRLHLYLALILLAHSSWAGGFEERYKILEKSIRSVGSNFREGDTDSISLALEKLQLMRERLREEKAEEEHSRPQLQAMHARLGSNTKKDAEPLLNRAESINWANIRRLGELIKLTDGEIQRLERRQSSIKPPSVDSGDFRLLPLPQSQ